MSLVPRIGAPKITPRAPAGHGLDTPPRRSGQRSRVLQSDASESCSKGGQRAPQGERGALRAGPSPRPPPPANCAGRGGERHREPRAPERSPLLSLRFAPVLKTLGEVELHPAPSCHSEGGATRHLPSPSPWRRPRNLLRPFWRSVGTHQSSPAPRLSLGVGESCELRWGRHHALRSPGTLHTHLPPSARPTKHPPPRDRGGGCPSPGEPVERRYGMSVSARSLSSPGRFS